jgi:uncharacterized repeat protein (TIGR01451 family)
MKALNRYFTLSFCFLFFFLTAKAQNPCVVDFNHTENGLSTTITTNGLCTYPTNAKVTFYYSFDDGSFATDSTFTFTHQFVTPGTYNVCVKMEALYSGQICMDSICDSITVSLNPCTGLFAQVIPYRQDSITGAVTLIASSNGVAPYTYHWSNNDSTETATYPLNNNGQYTTYCVTVSDHLNCSAAICDSFYGALLCNAQFGVQLDTNNTIHLPNYSTYLSQANAFWKIEGNGYSDSSNTWDASFHVPTIGKYLVCLTVQNGSCIDSACRLIDYRCFNYYESIVLLGVDTTTNTYLLKCLPQNGTGPYTYLWSPNSQTTDTIFYQPTMQNEGILVWTSDSNGCISNSSYIFNVCNDTICGIVFDDTNIDGIMDSTEKGIYSLVQDGYSGKYYATDSFGHYSIIAPCKISDYIWAYPQTSTYYNLTTVPLSGLVPGLYNYYSIDTLQTKGSCDYNFGFASRYIIVSGFVFQDFNSNGIQDSLEPGIPNQPVNIGNVYVYTDHLGFYELYDTIGTILITCTPTGYYQGMPTSPIDRTVVGQNQGQLFYNQNFAIQSNQRVADLSVFINPLTTVTPGFQAWYDVMVSNLSTYQTDVATTTFKYPPHLHFNFADAPVTVDAVNRIITISPFQIAANHQEKILLSFTTDSFATLGQSAFVSAHVTGQYTEVSTTNNVDSIAQVIVGSWDPNNKIPVVSNKVDNPNLQYVSAVNSNQKIRYTINFQNTGSAPAQNVVVKDELSNDLIESTFELIGASHPVVCTRNGNKLNFKFNNIQLKDKYNHESESHGFVTFTVDAKPGLQAGHVITDNAAIYFDFNAPVITNNADVTLVDYTSIDGLNINSKTVFISPNPFSEFTILKVNGVEGPITISVVDMVGKKVIDKAADAQSYIKLEREGLANGVYTYTVLQNGKAVGKGKMVVQ